MTTNNDENQHLITGVKEVIKDYDRRIRSNRRCASLYSKRYYALLRLADAHIKVKKYAPAEEAIGKALADCVKLTKLEPEDYDHPLNIGLLKEKLAHIKENQGELAAAARLLRAAIREHTKAIALESQVASIYCVRGNVYQSLSYVERKRRRYALAERCGREGIKDYNKAIKLGYSSAYATRGAAWVLLALAKHRRGRDFEQAITLLRSGIKDYSRAVDDDVPKPRLLYLRAESKNILAELKHKLKRKDNIKRLAHSAIYDYEAELREDPMFYRGFLGIASICYIHADSEFARANYAEALASIKRGKSAANEAIKLNSACVPAYYERAHLSFLQAAIAECKKDRELVEVLVEATIQDWRKLLEFEPDDKHFQGTLRVVRRALQQKYAEDGYISQSSAKQAQSKIRH